METCPARTITKIDRQVKEYRAKHKDAQQDSDDLGKHNDAQIQDSDDLGKHKDAQIIQDSDDLGFDNLTLTNRPSILPPEMSGKIADVKDGVDTLEPIKTEIWNWPLKKLKTTAIAKHLDASGTADVRAVACRLLRDSDDVDSLEPHSAGGGCPADGCIKTLCIKKYSEKIAKLREIFRDNTMTQAIKVIENYDDQDVLGDIFPLDRLNLAKALTPPRASDVADWRVVAEEFDMQESIPLFEAQIKSNNSFSPARALFRLLNQKYPQTTFKRFYEAVGEAGNAQVQTLIDKQVEDLAEQERSTLQNS